MLLKFSMNSASDTASVWLIACNHHRPEKHFIFNILVFTCLGLILFTSYLCDPFFIFSLTFIIINHTVSIKTIIVASKKACISHLTHLSRLFKSISTGRKIGHICLFTLSWNVSKNAKNTS